MKRESYFTEEERELDIYKRAHKEGFERGLREAREEKAHRYLIEAVLDVLHQRGLEPSDELKVALDGIRDQDRLIVIVGQAVMAEDVAALLAEIRARP